ncbi:hypothetical protein CONPUDRAFT_77893 [Coniophora puteana RWD-64-598 SS2]|uniref:Transmembrane protein n=1 Tax=Coniophora puteana (strain RWD-64-598) TaxID=741705 RepID=R7SFF9_CONPW|nr:uncharacterized protein CONPUDRAFT_77893 [Coniophora puteana RWD-64-598 SS2]EIW74610.1 hypothetical protein CONPUDRAFT_77893 [Coniophora puteana RWD-64-598 SS2]
MSLYHLVSILVSAAVQALPTGSSDGTSVLSSAEAPCSDSHRSLWTIVSTCLLTIFACVYTSVHPNVPDPYERLPAILRRAAFIMLFAVLAPELIVAWASRQWFSEDEAWTHTHSFYAYMGGFMVYHDGKPWRTITPPRLLEAVRSGNISPIRLAKKEIDDTSKGNFISKGLAVLQVTWFCMQLAARRRHGLGIIPLEVGTAGFAVLCCISYALWWDKPLNVGHPRRLEWKTGTPPGDLHSDCNHLEKRHRSEGVIQAFGTLLGWSERNLELRVETFGGDDVTVDCPDWRAYINIQHFTRSQFITVFCIGALSSTIFGLVHVAASELSFPTRTEQVLWEVSSLITVLIPLMAILTTAVLGVVYKKTTNCALASIIPATIWFIFCVSPALYVISRVALITIMFTSLRSLPPSSYETVPWTEVIPHL